jgi:serine/threonine protein kinase
MEEIGSSGNTAPEVFTHGGYDSKVDVWSFGIVLWELASSRPQDRSNPFVGLASDEFVSKAESGCRPSLAHAHQLCLGPVVEKCWSFDPLQRPTMHEVVGQLEQLCNAL